ECWNPKFGRCLAVADEEEFGLLITWTCYGTWLPGDKRGYVSDSFRPDGSRIPKENTPGTAYSDGDQYTRRLARQRQKWPTVYLNAEQAAVVVQRLVTSAVERDWRILRSAVMSNHVHVVVVDCPEDGPGVRRALKGPTQARLSEDARRPRRWWTQGGSDRYLYGENAIQRAVNYVATQHGILAEIIDMVVVEKQK
ncbi:MAG: hypothetical protein ABIP48_04010, partial [Planctomycetota bacterium]